jgi:predicted outer membrane repeat protein
LPVTYKIASNTSSGKGGGIAALNVYTTEEHRWYKELKRYKYAEFRVDEAQQKMTG